MIKSIRRTSNFKKHFKQVIRQGKDIKKFEVVLDLLLEQAELPEKYRDHALTGDYLGERDLHIEPDWLLLYHIENDELVLVLTDTGSHSDSFN
jgi:mRNA interferase YafQ